MPTSFAQWWNALVRHRVAAGLAFATLILVTVGVIVFAPRVYRSRSKLLLRIGHENATLDPTVAITGDAMTPLHTREDDVETAVGVMQSRSIMEAVVDRVGAVQVLQEKPPSGPGSEDMGPSFVGRLLGPLKEMIGNLDPVSERESAVRALEAGFEITAPSKSSVVSVEYHSEHPLVAQNIVDAWVDSYLKHHSQVNRTQGTYPFFEEQDAELRDRLDEAHRQLRDAKDRGGFATLQGQQQILEAQLETVRQELLRVDADLVESASRIESIGDLLSTVVEMKTTEETSGIANDARNEMRSLLFQLEVLEQEYAAKYKDTHPKLVAIRDQLENARKIVDSQDDARTELRETANPTHQQLSENRLLEIASQSGLQERKKALQAQRKELLSEIAQLNEHEERLAQLTRNVEVLEDRYRLHSVRFEQARLDKVLGEESISSINVVQPASYEQRPISPNKKLCALLGLFAAFAAAISLPVLLDLRHVSAVKPATANAGWQPAENPTGASPAEPAGASSVVVADAGSSFAANAAAPARPR